MLFTSDTLRFLIAYVVVLVFLALINKVEFKRHLIKGERYKALPLIYKFTCWLIVAPLFAGTVVKGEIFILGIVSFFLLENACVRWYRKAGLF